MNKTAYFLSLFVVANLLLQMPFLAQAYNYSDLKVSTDIFDNVDDGALHLITENKVVRSNMMGFIREGYRLNRAPVIRNKTAPFLLRIESAYYDEGAKEWRTVRGLGSLVSIEVGGKEYSAVLSVSHLTQGQKLRIYDLEGRSLSIVPGQRLANINEDLELILLKDKMTTPLKYQKVLGFMSSLYDMSVGVLPDDYELTNYDRVYVAKKQHVPILRSMLPKNSNGQDQLAFELDREVIAQNLVINKGLRGLELLKELWDVDGTLQAQFLGNGYVANARMLPGLSGAPLIRDIPSGAAVEKGVYYYSIEGLVQGHHRFENKSYFIGKKSIRSLVEGFFAGQRNYTSKARWRLRDGMTFRDYGNGVVETNMVKTPSSSFFKGDSGNAISVDGDKGVDPINIGMQNGYNSVVVGRFLKAQGKIIPTLADPQMDNLLPADFEKLQTFGVEQDLLKLAQMKYQLRDKFTNQVDTYKCFYQVTEKGIDLQVLKKSKPVTQWHRSQDQLNQGFNNNNFLIKNDSGAPVLEVSGLFLTDLSSLSGGPDPLAFGSPTITVLPFEGADAQKVGCYSDQKQMDAAFQKTTRDLMEKLEKVEKSKDK